MNIERLNVRRLASISMTVEETTSELLEMPERDAIELVSVLDALSDPVRLEIVESLAADGERACGLLAGRVADSTRSHHLRVLREAGVTKTRREGTKRLVSLRRDDLDTRFPGLLSAVLGATAAPPAARPPARPPG
jgi:DNA-binding transcriptional ArsR family regulator